MPRILLGSPPNRGHEFRVTKLLISGHSEVQVHFDEVRTNEFERFGNSGRHGLLAWSRSSRMGPTISARRASVSSKSKGSTTPNRSQRTRSCARRATQVAKSLGMAPGSV